MNRVNFTKDKGKALPWRLQKLPALDNRGRLRRSVDEEDRMQEDSKFKLSVECASLRRAYSLRFCWQRVAREGGPKVLHTGQTPIAAGWFQAHIKRGTEHAQRRAFNEISASYLTFRI